MNRPLVSAQGRSRKLARLNGMSVLPSTADVVGPPRYVRFVPEAANPQRTFTPIGNLSRARPALVLPPGLSIPIDLTKEHAGSRPVFAVCSKPKLAPIL